MFAGEAPAAAQHAMILKHVSKDQGQDVRDPQTMLLLLAVEVDNGSLGLVVLIACRLPWLVFHLCVRALLLGSTPAKEGSGQLQVVALRIIHDRHWQ